MARLGSHDEAVQPSKWATFLKRYFSPSPRGSVKSTWYNGHAIVHLLTCKMNGTHGHLHSHAYLHNILQPANLPYHSLKLIVEMRQHSHRGMETEPHDHDHQCT